MNNIFKVFALIIILAIPVVILVFLKSFGSNKYETPLYHQNGIPFEGCNTAFQPHRVTLPQEIIIGDRDALILFFPQYSNRQTIQQLKRVTDKFEKIPLIQIMTGDSILSQSNQLVLPSEKEMIDFLNCELVIGETTRVDSIPRNKITMLDNIYQIRGYYQGDNLEDMDRLVFELEILKTNVNQEHEP